MVDLDSNAKTIFYEALDRVSSGELSAYLDEACGRDAQLRRRVNDLLQAHQEAGNFLGGASTEGGTIERLPITEGPGTTIGPYKLLQQIGEGGFGVVFLADQERPVRRRVALKVIKPGMDTRQVIARFEAERQALAMMDHPNIAKVYDAGATENGRPYFVMELVQGVPITEYCDQCHLTTRERLELFITVCQAVQHAHQKGVIHRDIKPTNVLVAIQDGKPSPKIIDFGVAKAINQQLTEHTLLTAYAQIVGTPLYMSPEQAELSALSVDTRSDIYSMGVLLYELLIGATPIDKERLHAAPYDELRRIIREEEPPRPSARFSTLAADLATTVAERRRTDARRLSQQVRGELDWIVMKCLEKDRNRRYETINSLAHDIDRYLHDEPVAACPPSISYRFRKFARRHRVGLLAASSVVGVLILSVAGLGISNRLITAERNQKAEALAQTEVERQRAQDNFLRARIAIRNIVTKPAMGLDDWQQLPPPLRKRFSDEAIKFYESLIQGSGPNPSLQYEAAIGYNAIGALHSAARELQDAAKSYRQSVEIMDRLVAQYPNDRLYAGHLAWCYYNLGGVQFRQNQIADAQASVEKATRTYVELAPEMTGDLNFCNQLALCYRKLSEISKRTGNGARAAEFLRREIAILGRLTNAETADLSRDYRLGQANYLLGQLLSKNGELIEARDLIRCAIEQYSRVAVDSPTNSVQRRRATQGFEEIANFCAAVDGFSDQLNDVKRRLELFADKVKPLTGMQVANQTGENETPSTSEQTTDH